MAPKGDADPLAKALSPEAFANGDSPGLAAAKPPNPVPPEKELNPPPVDAPPVPRRLFPGVLGCPKVDPMAPNPDLPNWACPGVLDVPKVAPGCEGAPKEGAGVDGFPKAGAVEPPPNGEGLPNAEGADGFPNAVAPIVDWLPKAGAPDGFPKAEAPKGDGLPKED